MTAAELWTDTRSALEKFPLVFRLRRVEALAPRFSVFIDTPAFTVETVSRAADLKDIFRLRYDVFFREFAGRGDRFTLLPYDVDLHDFFCDHLVVREKASGTIVATYRLLLQHEGEVRSFYTESEFDLSEFRNVPGTKLELGRACVHPGFRSGAVISLLWKGLCQYARLSGTRYMFGCSSLCRAEFPALPYILQQLGKRGAGVSGYAVPVLRAYQVTRYPELSLPSEVSDTAKSMPSLMNMYLLAGAAMGTDFAYDEEMDCLDFFTVLDFTKLPPSFERRFA